MPVAGESVDSYCPPWRTPDTRPFPELRLLCAILRDVPRFGEQPACAASDPRVMDCETPDDVPKARDICYRCPAFDACATWGQRQRRSVSGMVAGRLRGHTR